MANENRNGLMAGLRRTSTSSSDWDVGLGLKMQPTESESSYPCKRTIVMLPPPHQHPASQGTVFNGDGEDGSSSSGPIFCNTNYQVASLSDIYDVAGVGAAAAVSARAVLPRTWHPFTSLPDIRALFTASQRQELERQTMIFKYMTASVSVPPELLLPLPKNHFHPPGTVSRSSSAALDVRFSIGSDAEPWRCRRTDGKKWRCSRNVTPGQKYCERHAHKSRPRSRKPVEIESHNTDATNSCTAQLTCFPTNTRSRSLRKPIAHFPLMESATSYDQTRGIELLTRGGSSNIPFLTCNQQWQHPTQSSSTMEVNRQSLELNEEERSFQVQHGDNAGGQKWENGYCSSLLDPKMTFWPGNLNAHPMQTTRHFIDASSAAEKRGASAKISEKGMKLPVSSLTLSIPGGNEIDEDHGRGGTSIRMMMGLDRNSEEGTKAEWLNPVTWMGTTPGGPLGEALCLAVASSGKGASNLPSPHGHSNSTTTTSSCSRSSCENGNQAQNFIG